MFPSSTKCQKSWLCARLAMLLPGKPLPPFSFSRRHSSCALGAMIVNLRFGVASSLTPSHYRSHNVVHNCNFYIPWVRYRRSMGQERTDSSHTCIQFIQIAQEKNTIYTSLQDSALIQAGSVRDVIQDLVRGTANPAYPWHNLPAPYLKHKDFSQCDFCI